MGSFNTTCFASGQTVAPGNPVRLFPVRQQRGFSPVEVLIRGERAQLRGAADSTCYPDAFWRPMSVSLSAHYDDYGRFVLTSDAANLRALELLLTEVLRSEVETLAGENRYHDVACQVGQHLRTQAPELWARLAQASSAGEPTPVELEALSEDALAVLSQQGAAVFAHLWEAAQEQRFFTLNVHGVPVATQFAVMHQSAYETLFDMGERRTDWENTSCERLTLAHKALGRVKSSRAELEPLESPELLSRLRVMQASLEAIRETFSAVGPGNGVRLLPETRGLERALLAYFSETLEEDALVTRVLELVSDRYVTGSLEALNLRFSPMVYAGQDYDNSIGRDYLRFVRTVSQRVSRLQR